MATKGRLVFDGDNLYTKKEARIYKLENGVESAIDSIPGVVDNLMSTSTTDALSANMGRELREMVDSLTGIGKFLSTWDATTGLPDTNPQTDPYTYSAGDYYIVSTVGATNYKPHGGTYTQGVPSTAVETGPLAINDKYYFDGADWVWVPDTAPLITIDSQLSLTSTNPVENGVITNALSGKQDTIVDLSTIRSGAGAGATALQPGDNITELVNNANYITAGYVSWGNISGTLSNQTDLQDALDDKQDKLTAGTGITIDASNVISSTGGGGVWGQITGTLTDQTDLKNALDGKQKKLTAGSNISISNNGTISATDTKYTAGTGISIDANNVISATGGGGGGGVWGQITGTLSDQTDLQNALNGKQNTLTAGTGISIDANNVISATGGGGGSGDVIGPNSSTDGNIVLFDGATGKIIKDSGVVLSSKADAADVNTKTFYLADTSDLTTAQDAIDWLFDGKNPIIVLSSGSYTITYYDSSLARFWSSGVSSTYGASNSGLGKTYLDIHISDGTVTSIANPTLRAVNYLATDRDYATPYTPQYAGSPATKKYVDDSLQEKQDELTAGDNISIQTVCHPDNQGPCPDGFHIPTSSEWQSVLNDLSNTFGLPYTGATLVSYLKMPYAGARQFINGQKRLENQWGYYWCCSVDNRYVYDLGMYSSRIDFIPFGRRGSGESVRPFKDAPVAPDSSWTTLYDGSSVAADAGVFHNATLGLISISVDGINWVTIADKNLGATVVYNDGDTLSQANCGNYYQWGNNYGFPRSGISTTSSTQVDASAYGPGNYYNNDTFVFGDNGNGDWSSVQNDNLRGGTSLGTRCQEVISATDTTYTAGNGISIDVNNEISNTLPGPTIAAAAPSSPTEGALWYDTTNDVLKTYDGTNWTKVGTKMAVLEYGVSTWQNFLDAYNENAIVYCKVSSGSSGYRMAFMAYTAGTTTPTEVEFQYYRSRSSHSTAANQLDEVYVYKLTNAGVWTTTQRDTAAKAIAGTGIGLSFNSSGMTINNTLPGATVASAQPSSSLEGDLWYDTTNDVLKSYDGTNWKEINNVKVFEGPFQAGFLSHAQDVYDWISTGKYAIVQHSGNDPYFNGDVIFSPTQVTTGTITSWDYLFTAITADGLIENNNEHLTMEVVDGVVTQVYHGGSSGNQGNIIINSNSAPTSPFTGSLWYDTTNNLLKRYDGANWNVISSNESLGGPNVRVSSTSVSDMRGPCPLGFHVPLGSEWGSLFTIFSTFNIANTAASRTTYFKLPGAGNLSYSNGNPDSSGEGHYWESGWSGRGSHAMVFWFGGSLDPTTNLGESFSHGNSIRPFKDTPVVPDSSWTVLYDGSSMATGASVYDPGIYHNPTLGLISASQDGEVWITMADKNLGAIVVYNSGDTCTRANSGNFYQWGNNFGFPYLGAKKTSSTLVDTSGYGPGNYYNNDTFVTMAYPGYKWFSPDNSNLWGGTTRSNRSGNVLSEEGQYSSLPILDSTSSPVANIGQMFYDIATDKVIVRTATGWKTLKFE